MLIRNLAAAAVLLGLGWGVHGLSDAQTDDGAEAAEAQLVDVTETTCGELAETTEMDRAFSLMFYYGYLIGRDDVAVIDGAAVTGHLEQVRDFCNANPDATVIDAFVTALAESS